MGLDSLLLLNLAVALAVMLGFWLASLPLRNVGIVDVRWGPGIAGLAWVDVGRPAPIRARCSSRSW